MTPELHRKIEEIEAELLKHLRLHIRRHPVVTPYAAVTGEQAALMMVLGDWRKAPAALQEAIDRIQAHAILVVRRVRRDVAPADAVVVHVRAEGYAADHTYPVLGGFTMRRLETEPYPDFRSLRWSGGARTVPDSPAPTERVDSDATDDAPSP